MDKKENVLKLPLLWIVIPCYNEEEVLPMTAPMFRQQLQTMIDTKRISDQSRILFVNDGSADTTWQIITALSKVDEHYIGIRQSRNRGHQNALLAGLMEAKNVSDVTISADCDGQDDIAAMTEMIDKYIGGCEIVYGVRSNRETDTVFKRSTAQLYYKLLSKMGAEVVYNHADYRLMSSRVLNEFADFHEVNLFLRGLVPMIGFPSGTVNYVRHDRIAGKSHYPISKMIYFAFDGITSLSIKPIALIARLGFLVSLIGLIGIVWAIVLSCTGTAITGWASLVCIVCFLGGIQLLSIGILGEYIGKIFLESKHRPRYIISEKTWKPYEREYRG